SARLVAMLPSWLPYAQAHFAICDETAQMLLALSARTVDRALKPHRVRAIAAVLRTRIRAVPLGTPRKPPLR
ncbi:MAG: hypothetical protein ACYDBO_11700, partial [Vulcanimicrobiaceae bacterium]